MRKSITIISLPTITATSALADPASIYSADGKFLGTLGGKYEADSINNPYEKYGSKYQTDSVNNPYRLQRSGGRL